MYCASLCTTSIAHLVDYIKRLVLVYILLSSYISQIISPTTLFLAAKVEEQPRKLEHVIKVAHACLNPQEPPLDTKSNVSSERSVSYMVGTFFFFLPFYM